MLQDAGHLTKMRDCPLKSGTPGNPDGRVGERDVTSQLILQPFRRFTYVTAYSPTLPLLHLRHSSFSNPSFSSPISQALHLIHLASRPCSFMLPIISATSSLFSVFSPRETIKHEINKYMIKFIIFNFFCSKITNLTQSKSRRWTPLVTSAVCEAKLLFWNHQNLL